MQRHEFIGTMRMVGDCWISSETLEHQACQHGFMRQNEKQTRASTSTNRTGIGYALRVLIPVKWQTSGAADVIPVRYQT